MAIYLAKFLSQKKQRKQVGSVHISNDTDGDLRKVSLILTPSLSSQSDGNKQTKNENRKSASKSPKKMKNSKPHFRVRLVLGVKMENISDGINDGTGWIPNARMFPNRCNNKESQLENELVTDEGTPMYNNALSTDLHHLSTTKILTDASANAFKPFTETWTLLKIWCLQRGFLRGHDTLSEKCIGITLAYLYRSKMVSSRMDCIQVFTVWMKFISDLDWLGEEMNHLKDGSEEVDHIRFSNSQKHREIKVSATNGTLSRASIVMPDSNKTEKQTVLSCVQSRLYAFDCKKSGARKGKETISAKTLLDCFKLSCEGPVFLDPTMTVNYFGHLSPSFMRELHVEAKLALKCINFNGECGASSSKPFKKLFLERLRFWRRYDSYLTIDLDNINFPTLQNKSSRLFWGSGVQDLGGYESFSRGLVRVLNIALGNRVTALRLLTTGNGECISPNKKMSKSGTDDFGTIPILDSDENILIPIRGSDKVSHHEFLSPKILSPVTRHSNHKKRTAVIGLRLNPQHCSRIVDRGPPADDLSSTSIFLSLWGKEKAQLRRFKDGAIVHAAVWNDYDIDNVQFEGGEKLGGIVEQIIAHTVKLHFYGQKSSLPCFALRNMTSLVEGITNKNTSGKDKIAQSSEAAFKDIVSAFEALSKFLTHNTSGASNGTSKLDLPLAIDSVEALSPFLRSTGLFPPLPHHLLGGHRGNNDKKAAGVLMGDSILVQIRLEGSSKWPSDINAMGAAKCAMLIQLAEGLEEMKEQKGKSDCYDFGGPINVTPSYVELGFRGYSWRIIVHADQELKMLSELRNPSQEAINLGRVLRKRHVRSASHHYTIHGVHTKYPASSYVVRLLQLWVATHLLSGLIPLEAIELIVAYIFTDSSALNAPMTASSGLLRSLHFLASHDWSR